MSTLRRLGPERAPRAAQRELLGGTPRQLLRRLFRGDEASLGDAVPVARNDMAERARCVPAADERVN